MAFNYDTNIKNILLSMSLSPYLPAGSSVGYGFEMTYLPGRTGSLSGAITMYDSNIVSTGTASLQIFIPTSSYLDTSRISQSIAELVTQYTDFPTGTADEIISTQVIYAPGEITTDACSSTCYQGELQWSFDFGSQLFAPGNYTNLANRQTVRPLKGGVSITSTSHAPPYAPLSVGTMGLICQDSASGALVGLTNNHVVIRDAYYTDQRTYTNPQNEYNLDDSSNTVQGDYVYQTGETTPTVIPGGPQEIGRVLRYVPLYTSASISANPSLVNKVDAAIFSLYCTSSTGATIIDFAATGGEQVGLTYGSTIPFASTAEIDNLLNTNYEFFSSGRTTGPKGSPSTLCPLRMLSYTSFPIQFKLQGVNTLSYFTDVIAFVKPAESSSYNPNTVNANTQVCAYPVWGGDSGSTLIANIGGVWKIIGLVFAGGGTSYNPQTNSPITPQGQPYQVASLIGYACRIDQVASQLGIKAWTGSAAPVVDHNTITYRTVSGSNDDKTLICSGSTYWQVGLTQKHNIC
jgi:hypothetical protein